MKVYTKEYRKLLGSTGNDPDFYKRLSEARKTLLKHRRIIDTWDINKIIVIEDIPLILNEEITVNITEPYPCEIIGISSYSNGFSIKHLELGSRQSVLNQEISTSIIKYRWISPTIIYPSIGIRLTVKRNEYCKSHDECIKNHEMSIICSTTVKVSPKIVFVIGRKLIGDKLI